MDLKSLLTYAVDHKASDLHITTGLEPRARIDGELRIIPNTKALDTEGVVALLSPCMHDKRAKAQLETDLDADFAFTIDKVGRFRTNIFQTSAGLAAAFRVIPEIVPTLKSLQLPETIKTLSNLPQGLVLVTGPTGSGKSTTLAAMIDEINAEKDSHIITIEDPIEFIYKSNKSLIHQREVGRHTTSFTHALRAALREDPDIILVGEMRDLDTIRLALTAAETGHLVFATLHTPSAAQSIYRIVDVFPGDEKELVRAMLSESLQAIIAQTLLPKKGGGRVAAMEIMIANSAIRNLIRENKIAQMASIIQTNAAIGMQTTEQHIKELKSKKIID